MRNITKTAATINNRVENIVTKEELAHSEPFLLCHNVFNCRLVTEMSRGASILRMNHFFSCHCVFQMSATEAHSMFSTLFVDNNFGFS